MRYILLYFALTGVLCGCAMRESTVKNRVAAKEAKPAWGTPAWVLNNLETSLWVSAKDLYPGVVVIHGKAQILDSLNPPEENRVFGFGNGAPGNMRTESLSITIRGKRLEIPEEHYTDLYNLEFSEPDSIRFGSIDRTDAVSIMGSSGERGYHVIYFSTGGSYAGRRVSTLFGNYDTFAGKPEQVSKKEGF